VLTRVAVAVVSLYVLYVAASNVFLSTSLFGRVVNADPTMLFVSYERAWSLWPGSVHARRLAIRGSDSQVEWLLRLESCSFELSLVDLALHKTVHFQHPRGAGVTFDLRTRVAAPAATPEYVDALPAIPGFPRIPLKLQKLPDLDERWNDRAYHLWSVELSDVVADDVREVWIDSVRIEGAARITGGFFLKPIRKAQVGPVHVDARELRIAAKDRRVAESVAGTFDVELEEFDPRTVTQSDLLNRLSVTTELRGRAPDLANLPRTLTGPVRLSGPVDVPRLALQLHKGRIDKRTHVDLVATDVAVEASAHRIAGNLVLAADVADVAGPASLTFRLEGRALGAGRVGRNGDAAPVFRAAALDLTGTLDSPMLDLADPRIAWHGEIRVPDAELVDRKVLGRYLPPGKAPEVVQGHEHFDVHGTFTMADHTAAGAIDVHAGDLAVVLAPLALSAEVRAHLAVRDWAFEEGTLVVDAASVTLTGAEVRRAGSAAPAISVARVVLGAKSEAFTLSDPLARVDLDSAIEDGKLLDASVLDSFLANGSGVTVDAAQRDGRFSAALRAAVDGHVARGSASAHTRGIGVRTPKLRVRGGLDATADVSAWSLDENRMRGVSASVRASDVAAELGATIPGTGAPSRADLRSRSIELRARAADVGVFAASLRNVDYRLVVVDLEMDDAAKLGVLLSGSGGNPAELAIESGVLRGSADISVSPSARTATGGARLVVAGAGVRFHKTRLRGSIDADLHVAGLVPGSGHVVDITGSRIALRDVETVGATAESTAWNGDLALLRGALQVSDTPGLDAVVQLDADDANPILALTLENKLPGFVVGRFKAPGLSAQARIVIERGRAAILDAQMRGDNVAVAGDFVARPEHVRAAFTVAKGKVSAGVKIDDEGTSVVLFGLESWRAREKGAVRALFAAPTPAKAKAPPPAR
jgi:hypothetical protein